MNPSEQTTHSGTQAMIDALTAARDQARVRMHLLSLEARERWLGLESRLDSLQTRIERDGIKGSEAATKRVHELTLAVQTLLRHEIASALENTVGQVMKPACTCASEATLNDAAQIMWDMDCGCVPVVDGAARLVGIVTDRDISMAAYTRGVPLAAIPVAAVMTRDVVRVAPSASVEDALQLMRQERVRRLPVVEDGRVVGIVSLADVAQNWDPDLHAVTGQALASTLSVISQPRRP